ncbi:hypothetical protein DVH26_27570 [Paenibacillus sp. H1-7]|uniref:hypothetical protein n=1 Tax=Paenibacillus sp. H1-7 TaxID=2282849 RepID=UPI001EF84B2C|nr:hypothetical protein [Paenibacillus sp. H1-7]ULL17890.1 hypothetical protein DVH26_27570 [Paenibacillus sp. H1-7]
MTGKSHDNVILFPKTVDYYQFELTRMLENERYGEAISLLRFLLTCRSQDERVEEEWNALLQWLQTMFPDETFADFGAGSDPEDELSERDMLREKLILREREDGSYAAKLMESLKDASSLEKQLLALDQLALMEHPELNGQLIDWIKSGEQHPLIQYKTLQTLKLRGVQGLIELHRNGESVLVEIEDTPADFDQFPSIINEIIERIQQVSETNHPALAYFAQETWNEFLAFIYGTYQYRQMLRMDRDAIDAWAAALHLVLLERVFDSGDKEEILELYGITSELLFQWEQAYRIMQQFASSTFSGGFQR